MKRIIYIISALLTCLTCAFCAFACTPSEPTGEVTLTLDKESVTVDIDGQTSISATTKVGGTTVGASYVWSVSQGDVSVVSLIQNGGAVTVEAKNSATLR
ncbi:MAG: hypothetical protein IKM16_03085 [Clostridia bacterium]|nr:hypothetical protein [Clostridia bacterium]